MSQSKETISVACGIYNREIDKKLSRKKSCQFLVSVKMIELLITSKLRMVWIIFMTWDKYGHYFTVYIV